MRRARGRPPSNQEGEAHVMDNRRHPLSAVVARINNVVHTGRIHSHPPRGRRNRDHRSIHSGPSRALKSEMID